MNFTAAEIAAILDVDTPPSGPAAGWSIDSRTLNAGDVYIALRGERHDGHSFLGQAAERGAVAAIVSQQPVAMRLPVIQVENTEIALQELARAARLRMRGQVIGVTGSSGKTTVKEAIAAVLGSWMPTGFNEGNLNNHIGLPLSLLRQQPNAAAYVFEMGMNHAGEVRFLASIAKPHVAVITNIGTAHIENLGTRRSIALAKRELMEALPRDGVALLNADDSLAGRFAGFHSGRSVTYGFAECADFRATHWQADLAGCTFRVNSREYRTALPGRHNVLNVTAAIGIGLLFGVPERTIAEAVDALRPPKMRGEVIDDRGVTIINDSYNSNPEAAMAMIEYLAGLPSRRKIAVLGEMLELGAESSALHRSIGKRALALGIDYVAAVRGTAASIAEGFGQRATFYETPEEAGDALIALAQPGDAVLFKASRGTRIEKALERFMAR